MSNSYSTTQKIFIFTAILMILSPITAFFVLYDEIIDIFTDLEILYISIFIGFCIVSLFGAGMLIYNFFKRKFTKPSLIISQVFMPICLLFVLGGFIYLGAPSAPEDRGPYLSWTQDPKTTMTITFETKTDSSFDILLGIEPSILETNATFTKTAIRAEDGYFHYTTTITNLEANTTYYYGIPGFSPEITGFRTAPDSTLGRYKFILYGDSREPDMMFGNQHIPLVNQILNEHDPIDISFVLNTGDTAGSHDDIEQWNLHFHAIHDVAKSVPYFVASGNHEWNGGEPWYSTENQPAIDIQEFPTVDIPNTMYSLNETSYAFGYANAYFIMIGEPHAGKNNSVYLNWLNNQLAVGNSTYDFTFVSLHRPPFDNRTGGDFYSGDDNPDIIQLEAPMFHYGGVDAVFAGHNHVLAHQNITWADDPVVGRNVTYIIAGGGGAGLREPEYGNWANEYGMGFYGKTIYAEKINHYYLAEMDGTAGTATFTAYSLDGEIIEQFTIQKYK
ncbi:MAG: purple acid phosphatase family protein [Promethearchaeota archaeon]